MPSPLTDCSAELKMDPAEQRREEKTGKKHPPSSKPLNLMRALIGNCVCGNPFQDHRGGLNSSDQLVELHGIHLIGLGALSDELTPRERVYDTLEQLTTRTDRLISVGYIMSEMKSPGGTAKACQKVIDTVPLDVWNQNFPNDRNMSSDVRRTIDRVQKNEFDLLERDFEKKLDSQTTNLNRGNNAYLSGITAHNLGVIKVLLGKEKEAEVLFRRAITLKEAAFGNHHHEIALSWGELGIQHFARGDFGGALAAFRRAHELESSGMEDADSTQPDPELALVLNNIACCYFQMGRHHDAHQALLEARNIQHELVGSTAKADLDLLHVATVICNCGYLTLALRRYDEAQSLFEEALLIQQSVLDDNHRAVRDTRSNIEFANVFHA